jgi:uncharacterized membrane protein
MDEMDDMAERTVATRAAERENTMSRSRETPGGGRRGAEPELPATNPDPWAGGATQEIEPLGLARPEAQAEGVEAQLTPVPSVAQIGGHPLHPAVVPLPMGVLSFALVTDLAYVATRDRFWARSSETLIFAGLVTGAVAATLGAADFLGRERTRRHGEAWLHAGGNIAVLGISALNLALRRDHRTKAIVPAGLMLSAISGMLLGVTGWLGGELTYRHRIGVTRSPE